jgi:hypothetical protein
MPDPENDPQGFATIPRWLLYRADVTIYAKVAYLVISSHANRSGTAWPSLQLIANEGSMSRESAKRGMDQLLALGVIERRARSRRDGGRGSNIYSLVTMPDDSTPVD